MWISPEDKFLFSPTEPASSATPPDTTPVATETQTEPAAQPTTPVAATTTEPAQPSAAPSSAPAQAAAPSPSWLDSFRKEGFQANDEETARKQLLQSYRDAEQLRPLAPALSAYQQHAQQFHQWLADQQKTQQAAQKDWTQAAGWSPPGDYEALRRQVTTDANGNIIAAPGAPPDAVVKFQAANAYRQEFAEKFLNNPGKALEPYIWHIAQAAAQQFANQGVGQYRDQQEANQFIEKHADWLFEQENGAPKVENHFNPSTGAYESKRVLGQWGKLFVQNLQTAAQRGLPADVQQQYALQAVQNAYMVSQDYADWLVSQQRQAVAPQPAGNQVTARQQANSAFTQRTNPATPPAPRGSGNAVPAPQKVTRENLDKIMLQRIQEAGASTS